MDIISAIRKVCEGEKGFYNLFDKAKSYDKLCALTDDKKAAELFTRLIYGKARGALVELIKNAYKYKDCEGAVIVALMGDGLSGEEAVKALEIFYKAFGFPDYREMDKAKVSTLKDAVNDLTIEYVGEVQGGKEYGVGARTCYYNGEFCNYDECVWINGVMNGYNSAREIEFGAFETRKIGFVADDNFVGNTKCIYGEDEEIDSAMPLHIV